MAILHSVNSRDFPERESYTLFGDLANPHYYLGNRVENFPVFRKMSFTFRISLAKSLYEERHFRNNRDIEDTWIHSKISSQLELEDPSGKLFPIDDIFFENHRLPTKLRQGEFVNFYPDNLMRTLQDKNLKLYVKLVGDDPHSSRLLLDKPIIIRLDKLNSIGPRYIYDDVPPMYRGMDIHDIDLEFEILCDSYTVPSNHFSNAEINNIMKDYLKENLIIKHKQRQEPISKVLSKSESKAIDSLRDMLSEKDFRKYLINGFIMVRSSSGKWYQIFKNQKHIRVYDKGVLTKELCIHTDAKEVPPTDHVLNMKILVECDESLLWDLSNKYEPKKLLNQLYSSVDYMVLESNKSLGASGFLFKLKKDNTFLKERAALLKRRGCHGYSRAFA